jgi:hypothetical protein
VKYRLRKCEKMFLFFLATSEDLCKTFNTFNWTESRIQI